MENSDGKVPLKLSTLNTSKEAKMVILIKILKEY